MTPKRPGISEPPYWKAPWARYYAWLCLSLQGHRGISEGPFHSAAEDNCAGSIPGSPSGPLSWCLPRPSTGGSLWNDPRRVTQILGDENHLRGWESSPQSLFGLTALLIPAFSIVRLSGKAPWQLIESEIQFLSCIYPTVPTDFGAVTVRGYLDGGLVFHLPSCSQPSARPSVPFGSSQEQSFSQWTEPPFNTHRETCHQSWGLGLPVG